ncbi:MAG: response regulator transcription factor [Candidatus Dormibacteria bacterium]
MGPERGRLLVVDDDPISLAAIKAVLEPDGYRVDSARTGREALSEIAIRRPDCVVLDYAMPEMTGLEVVRALRESGNQTPVIMFSAKSDSYDKTAGYASGADIYIGKDEDPGVLRAAVGRVLQHRQSSSARIEMGGLVLDTATWSCEVDGSEVRLPRRLFSLLRVLASQPGCVVRKEQLVYQVWGVNSDVYNRAVDNSIVELRKLLGDPSSQPRFIHTVRGVGYKFQVSR